MIIIIMAANFIILHVWGHCIGALCQMLVRQRDSDHSSFVMIGTGVSLPVDWSNLTRY